MKHLNEVLIIGNVGKDVATKQPSDTSKVTNFSVASTKKWSDNKGKHERTTWFQVEAWGPLSDIADVIIESGAPVLVRGEVSSRAWLNKDGKAQATLIIRATELILLRNLPDNGESESESDLKNQTFVEDDGIPF